MCLWMWRTLSRDSIHSCTHNHWTADQLHSEACQSHHTPSVVGQLQSLEGPSVSWTSGFFPCDHWHDNLCCPIRFHIHVFGVCLSSRSAWVFCAGCPSSIQSRIYYGPLKVLWCQNPWWQQLVFHQLFLSRVWSTRRTKRNLGVMKERLQGWVLLLHSVWDLFLYPSVTNSQRIPWLCSYFYEQILH
jgi:hypothetical protein